MASSGYNVMYPYSWLQTAGDGTGDANFQVVNQPEGDFFSQTSQSSGPTAPALTANVVGAWSPESGMVTTGGPVDATYSGYVNAAMMNPGSQAPVVGTPALMNGDPRLGPVAYSDYASGTLPSQYLSPMPAWKSAPMQMAHQSLPVNAQNAAAAAAAAQSPSGQHTHAIGQTGGCAGGCSGGCGRKCQGRNPPLGLDSTNDFLPLYAHPTANAAQVVGAHLYQNTSTKMNGWPVSQGAPADHETPVQGQ
jgi:hypothetical protein